MLTFFIGDLLPIIVIMLLGYFGNPNEKLFQSRKIKPGHFNKLVLNYALPAALFVSITRANEMIFCGHSPDPCITCGYCRMFLFLWFGCYKFLNVLMQKQQYVH
ncbi:AEC family transporter [Escherichia coli]|nr:AEC family transporter [Escherichia coli]